MIDPINPISGYIHQDAEATASVTKHGEEIGLGSRMTHLAISGLDDKRLYIPVQILSESSAAEFTSPTNPNLREIDGKLHFRSEVSEAEGSRTVWVDVDEFATRLHFSRDKVELAASSGKINELLEKRADFSKVLDTYQRMADNYEKTVVEDSIQLKSTGQILTAKTLMKMVRVGLRIVGESGGASLDIPERQNLEGIKLETATHPVLALRDEKGNLHLNLLKGHIQPHGPIEAELASEGGGLGVISQGTFSRTYAIFNIGKAQLDALKVARGDTPAHIQKNAATQAKQEADILNILHEGDIYEGLIEPPHILIDISSPKPGTPPIKGYLQTFMEGGEALTLVNDSIDGKPVSLANGGIDERPRSELVWAINDLISGLDYMQTGARGEEELKLATAAFHGDIKPDNILARENSDGKLELRLADWGNARTYQQVWESLLSIKNQDDAKDSKKLDEVFGTHTNGYIWSSAATDLNYLVKIRLQAGDDQKKLEACKDKLIEFLLARDTFAMGISLYILLTGIIPLEEDKDGFANIESKICDPNDHVRAGYFFLVADVYGEAVADAVAEMIRDPYNCRSPGTLFTDVLLGIRKETELMDQTGCYTHVKQILESS